MKTMFAYATLYPCVLTFEKHFEFQVNPICVLKVCSLDKAAAIQCQIESGKLFYCCFLP